MYDFPNYPIIQSIIKTHYEKGEIVAAICHGVCGLLNVKLSDNSHLIKGKTLTGFNWFEETLANRRKQVPFNLEAALKERGAEYKKAFLPITSRVVKDGNLNNNSKSFLLQRGGQSDNGCSKKQNPIRKLLQTILEANGPIGEAFARELKRNYTPAFRQVRRHPTKVEDSEAIFSADLYTVPNIYMCVCVCKTQRFYH